MNARERTLAILLVGIMFVAVGGVGAYQLVYVPYKKSKDEIVKVSDEVDKLETDRQSILIQQKFYETRTKKRSLPLDNTLAQREYGRLLDRMLRKAEFDPTTINITPRAANTNNVPTVGNKKPIYTKLDFDLRVKGSLLCLVDFMHNFYRQPLLHQIRTINVVKPGQSNGQGRAGYDLEITLAIEALVLDKAEDRPTLLPAKPFIAMGAGGAATTGYNMRTLETGLGTPFSASGVLARGDDSLSRQSADDEYRRIAGKNIFFGPPPVVKSQDEQTVKEMDLAPYLGVVRISHSEGKSEAEIFDRANKHEFEIEINRKGQVTVKQYYYLRFEENGIRGETRKKLTEKSYFQFGKEETGNLRRYFVRRIMENQILLEEYSVERDLHIKGPIPLAVALTLREVPPLRGRAIEPALTGKMYTWQVGQLLKSELPGKGMKPVVSARDCWYDLVRPLNLTNEPLVEDKPAKPLKPVAKLPLAAGN